MGILRSLGRGSYNLFVGTLIAVLIAGGVAVATNYTMTQGSGLTFGSIVASTVNYPQMLLCDLTTPASQCAAVNGSGQIAIQAPPSLPLPTGAATSANQTNASQKTQIVDGSGNVIASTTNALNVDCVTGCAAGTTSNATSGVATSSTNSATVAYNYGFNGTTWDQLQTDASKNLKVTVANASTDPCTNTKTNFAWGNSSGTTQLVAPSGSTQVYVCSFSLIAAATAVVNLVGGTGASCTTGTPVAALGSTTPASGMSLAANGGLTYGSGLGTVVRTTTAGHGLCLIQSGTTALAGNITYVQQ